jgi:cytochrome c-type biogenesis protein CcmH
MTPATEKRKLPPALASTLARRSTWVVLGLVLLLALVWTVTSIRSRQPETLDQRTMDVASQLQCPVCHGESVADAPSPLAQEMRSLIREELSQGMSEQQVINYFHARYGDEILESPPTTGFTSLIWLAPVLIVLLGAFMLLSLAREWRRVKLLAPETVGRPDADPIRSRANTGSSENTSGMSPEERSRYLSLLRRELEAEEGYSWEESV